MTSLRELALLFFRLGATAFGGPAAHIALMHDEVVTRRRWLSEERFVDLVGATNLIPGPSSTELAIHIGFERRRWAGLLVAGSAFIIPAMLITGALGWAYVTYGTLPAAQWILYGVKPVMLAVVAQALWKLGVTAAKTRRLQLLAILAAAAVVLGTNELLVLFGAGAIAMATTRRAAPLAVSLPAIPLAASLPSLTPSSLFLVFAKIGSVLFGSGYVLLAFLRADLVERLHWLSEAQLLDAIAAGQITPGPVFTTATFIGYVLLGPAGACVATAGIFLPAFFFVAISGPLVPKLRASPTASAFLDGVNAASLALMTVVSVQLGRAAIADLTTAAIALVAAVLVWRKVGSTWLVLAGAALGWLTGR